MSLLLWFLGLVFALATGEGVVQIFHLAPLVNRLEVNRPYGQFVSSENPILKYVPQPGSADINAYGIRDHDYPIEKPRGVRRYVVLGDSIAFGFCTDDEALPIEKTFPKVLERQYRAQGRPIDVINLAVPGYDTVQEVEFFVQKGLALKPAIVILAYSINDSWTASAELWHLRRMPGWFEFPASQAVSRVFHASHLARFVWQRVAILTRGTKEQDFAKPKAGLERLKALSDQYGFHVIVVVFPLFEDFTQYPYQADHDWVRGQALRHGFTFVDLLEPFARHSQEDRFALQGRCSREHPDERGHQVAAEALSPRARHTAQSQPSGGYFQP